MSVPQGQPVQPQGIALQQRQPQFQGQPQQQFQGQPQQVYQAQPTGAQPPGQVEAKTSTGQVFYQEPTLRAEPAAPPSHQRMQDKPWTDPEFSVPEYACICTMCLLSIPCYFCNVQTIQTYERGVVLRLGKQMHKGTLHGGMHLVLPTVDELLKIDIRETIIDIPRQAVVTREGLNISVDGVVFYKVFDATRALLAIKNVKHSINLLAQTKLREVLALFTYEQIQLERKSLADTLKKILDTATDAWGIDVTRVELTDLTLPAALAQAMGAEAEARRRAQAGLIQAQGLAEVNLINAQNAQKTNLIHAETTAKAKEIEANALAAAKLIEAAGEEKAAEGFKNAAEIMNQAPGTMQLRFLQTLGRVGAGAGNTIMVPYDPATLQSTVQANLTKAIR